ncbi:alkaline phosphatase family protein [Pseudarthrobacter sp. J64]|uniref:alkaline phosphatase family protein n=1 Tax=Pseudarthrobacter sp. J64 TaxID=3116485 RepID=UPI002E810460|nr:alkaline phosphatase family protein [Pseudarthrobacter sp. J64]MEE2570494.1 alkaline phosphatase family protein [Pseudarthrobacter sp. J64]
MKNTTPHKGLPSGTLARKTLVIGLDGATFAAFDAAGVPRLDGLMGSGMTAVSNLFASPMAPTLSAPAWSSIATGVWPDKHRVLENSFAGAEFDRYPDFLSRLKQAIPGASTAVVGTWAPIPGTLFCNAADVRLAGRDDAETVLRAADYLTNGNPDGMFVHLDEVDEAGHSSGTASGAYLTALRRADERVGQLLDAVRRRPEYAVEEWLIMVVADHGHTAAGGHGGHSAEERQVFVIVNGPGIEPGSVRHDVKLTDIAPSVLRHAGIAVDTGWDLDGRCIQDLMPDAFDGVRGELIARAGSPAAAFDGVSVPHGWSVDNSAMPEGGVTGWRGWTFTTDDLWTGTGRGQGRETSVRHRNVFAVADSANWGGAGAFHSTLISPDFQITEGSTAALSFAGNFRAGGSQAGDVLVSFDGAAPQLVRSYRSDSNGFERIKLDVPAGATQAAVHFRYTGTGGAFWTVDQVLIQPSE